MLHKDYLYYLLIILFIEYPTYIIIYVSSRLPEILHGTVPHTPTLATLIWLPSLSLPCIVQMPISMRPIYRTR
jgi:hypothetical protein